MSCTLQKLDGRTETVAANYLLGCDGAHSLVRQTLGFAFEGDTFLTNFILADVHVAGLNLPTTEMGIFWHHDGMLLFFPIAPGRYRIIADIGSNARHDPTLEEAQAIVNRRGPAGVTLSDPIWMAGFAINERKVKDYSAGRVFLAGDAAHIHSPAGGQGMNTGMQDEINLAWKLALIARGNAKPTLLDSYSLERSPVAKQILSDSGQMTRVAMLKGAFTENLRNFAAHHILGLSKMKHFAAERLSEVTIGYPDSPLNSSAAKGLSGAHPGQRIIADRPFGAGDTPHFALLATDDGHAQATLQRYETLLEPSLRTPPDTNGIWLVRPDGYVAATARAGDWQTINDCLARIATHSPP